MVIIWIQIAFLWSLERSEEKQHLDKIRNVKATIGKESQCVAEKSHCWLLQSKKCHLRKEKTENLLKSDYLHNIYIDGSTLVYRNKCAGQNRRAGGNIFLKNIKRAGRNKHAGGKISGKSDSFWCFMKIISLSKDQILVVYILHNLISYYVCFVLCLWYFKWFQFLRTFWTYQYQ